MIDCYNAEIEYLFFAAAKFVTFNIGLDFIYRSAKANFPLDASLR